MALLLVVNGQARNLEQLPDGAALDQVVAALELAGDRIAVEQNGTIQPRRGWAEARVSSGDRLEIVHFVGGGTHSQDIDTMRR